MLEAISQILDKAHVCHVHLAHFHLLQDFLIVVIVKVENIKLAQDKVFVLHVHYHALPHNIQIPTAPQQPTESAIAALLTNTVMVSMHILVAHV